ncbi:Small protein A precursor [Providencia rustigianii]|nr:Small protein A precursor [Providencia rustigianii]
MTQQQVAYTLGTPMMTDPFGSQTWFYVFRQELGHDPVKQETLTLTFDRTGILTDIKNEKNLEAQQAMEANEIKASEAKTSETKAAE